MRIILRSAVLFGLLPLMAAGSVARADEATAPDVRLAAVLPQPDPALPGPAPGARPAAAPAGAVPLTAASVEFGLYALGAKAFDIKVTMRREADAVHVDTAMRTFGPLDFMISFELTGYAAAELRDGRVIPVRYGSDSDGSWSKRSTRITWDADGMPSAVIQPPLDEDDREPVPDALKRNTLDPTTAIVARVLQGGATPPCTGSDAIFDGRRRYNLHYSPVGPAQVAPRDRTAYAGPAYECSIRFEPVAGYSRKDGTADTRPPERPTRIWLVRPPGIDAWLPVQIDTAFRLGSAEGWIAGARLNGRTWLEALAPIRAELQREITP